jgi:hypothetical protein
VTNDQLNDAAFALRTKLFNLINEFRDLQSAASNAGSETNQAPWDTADQIDTAACRLAEVHLSLGHKFTEAVA